MSPPTTEVTAARPANPGPQVEPEHGSASRMERADHRCVPATVLATTRVALQLHRLTLAVTGLAGWAPLGPDEFVGLVLPRPGTRLPDLSGITGPNPRPVVAALPEPVRPDVRWYTVADHRPAPEFRGDRSTEGGTTEIDVDVVLHPPGEVDEGPGATWVRRARPGDELAVQTGTTCYHPPATARTRLVAGDETAYPALRRILQEEGDVELHAVLEVDVEDALPPLPRPRRGSVDVVLREGRPPGEALLAHLRSAELPDLDYGWVVGEQDLAARVRRHLVRDRGLARTSVYFCAYWILGRPRG
ncbi:siderophore-interacting protein [Ornithinimicrobium sp. W1665]|uniref:siderophore-interacting protein n=1 Tax=Ornithinimicrobium sp. W1665 TaxID=3416666 RepID=UPI003CF4499A